jgi:hypothetical protein
LGASTAAERFIPDKYFEFISVLTFQRGVVDCKVKYA